MSLQRANITRPRRTVKPATAILIDLTVTPPDGSAGEINAGEYLYLTSNGAAASLNTTGASNVNAANGIGVAIGQYPVTFTDGVTGSPIPPDDPNTPMIQYLEDGDHLFDTTADDTYNPYDTVYLGANGRTISKTATGSALGYVCPDQRQVSGVGTLPNNTPITGGAGVQIWITIKPPLAK